MARIESLFFDSRTLDFFSTESLCPNTRKAEGASPRMVSQTVGGVAGVEGLGEGKAGLWNLDQWFPDPSGLPHHLGTVQLINPRGNPRPTCLEFLD